MRAVPIELSGIDIEECRADTLILKKALQYRAVEQPDNRLPTLKRVLDWEGPSLVEVSIDPAAHHEVGEVSMEVAPQYQSVVVV